MKSKTLFFFNRRINLSVLITKIIQQPIKSYKNYSIQQKKKIPYFLLPKKLFNLYYIVIYKVLKNVVRFLKISACGCFVNYFNSLSNYFFLIPYSLVLFYKVYLSSTMSFEIHF